ncbi:MAG: hypothetical protein P8Z31_06185 [Gammaproteobacteria bacterium]
MLDASGSMWGQVEGRPKIEIAREVVGSIIADWDESVPLGLTVYGHRRKGDCNDIESVIGVGPVDKRAFMETVNRINPRGKTPLSQAVVQAARELRYTEEKATVILVSDGKETCHMDPCAVGRELEEAGVDFTAHIIGFDVKDKFAIGQLRCLAENTGGTFTLADNAESLKEALQRAVAWSRVSLRAPEYIFSDTLFEVEWEGPNAPGDRIVFVPRGAPDNAQGVFAMTAEGSPARLTAPSGTGPYEVRYVYGPDKTTILKLDVTLRGSAATVKAPARVMAGTAFEVAWTGPNHPGDKIVLMKVSQEEAGYYHGDFSCDTSGGSPCRLTAFSDPGDYEVRYLAGRGAKVLARQAVRLVEAVTTLKAPAEVEAGMDFEVRWTGPGSPGDLVLVVKKETPDGRYMTGGFAKTVDKGSPVILTAYTEPGDYEIRYQAHAEGKVIARIPLMITPATLSLDAPDEVMAGSSFEVTWSGSGRRGDRILLMPKGTSDRRYMGAPFSSPPGDDKHVELTAFSEPGDYEVRYLSDADGKVIVRQGLRILPADIQLTAPDEVVAGHYFDVSRKGGENISGNIILVRASTPEGSYFSNADFNVKFTGQSSVRLRAFEEPGDYEIRFMAAGDGKSLAVTDIRVLPAPEK